MSTQIPLLAPPATPSAQQGPLLCPRTPTQPKPGYVLQSTDLRIAAHRPPTLGEVESDFDPGLSQIASSRGNEDGDHESIDDQDDDEDLPVVPLTLKGKKRRQSKVKQVRANVCPRGSGASVGLVRVPAKKKKVVSKVCSIVQ